MSDRTYLLLGGAGLVGLQVARRIAQGLAPQKIVLVALSQDELDRVLEGPAGLRAQFQDQGIEFVGEHGNVFVRDAFAQTPRHELLESQERRQDLYEDLHGPVDQAYERSRLAQLIQKHRPDVIVDSINTAGGISYQDVYSGSVVAKRDFERLTAAMEAGNSEGGIHEATRSFESLLLSLSVPQLIRHVMVLHRAMTDVGTRLYLKIGTTGTGGMGLNVPYTHSEDRPSAQLMTKTAVAFAHTGLLFLMARTVGGPVVKEVKPGALIGYADITQRPIRERGKTVSTYASRDVPIDDRLVLRMADEQFDCLGDLVLPVVDTGENGLFTRGEFAAITSIRQMEFITPEEIARDCVLEIHGSNTGHDVIAAIDGAVMNSTYRAGVLRQQALDNLAHLERKTGSHSVALGQLGPPELGKLLWEAQLLRLRFETTSAVLEADAAEISRQLEALVQSDATLRNTVTSVGLPILSSDGRTLIRGPFIRIPEVAGVNETPVGAGDVDAWAAKGWVDLRPANFKGWQKRFEQLEDSRQRTRMRGSAAVTREAYLHTEIDIGSVVGWIFNNEMGAYRIK